MLEITRHRGPDACGVWTNGGDRRVIVAHDPDGLVERAGEIAPGNVLLAQSRLAITGTAKGVQPFTSADGRLAFAHNGEFYNHDQLRGLLPPDADVTTGSDSEVLARLVESYHAKYDLAEAVRRALDAADGMFATAVTDGETLVLARDAIGKKPIYYCEGDAFAFASERKALAPLARRFGATVRRLLPGDMLVVTNGGADVEVRTWKRLAAPPIEITDADEAVEAYEAALVNAIKRRTRGMKKAAVLFSGGVDSVLVAQLLKNEGLEVYGYTMGMEGSGDLEAARASAKEMGIKLREAIVDEEMLEAEIPEIIRAAELAGPLQVEVSIPMWFSSKMAHEDGHRVIFTGQAADEIMAGYDWYRKVVGEEGHLELHGRLWEDILALPLDTLEREDRITMAHSLEMRAPFLDHGVIRTAMRIAPQIKLHAQDDLMRKHTHRFVADRAGVPKSIAFREKSPAQEGANVHMLLDLLAKRRYPDGADREEEAFPDFGSNYRYRDTMGQYATNDVHVLLRDLVAEHDIAVADANGELRVDVPVRIVPATASGEPAEATATR